MYNNLLLFCHTLIGVLLCGALVEQSAFSLRLSTSFAPMRFFYVEILIAYAEEN